MPDKMKIKKILEPYSDEWTAKANRLLRDYYGSPSPCSHCNYPVVDGYCCMECGSNDPQGYDAKQAAEEAS